MSDQPTFDKLVSAEEILVALREHLQQLELREARQGYNTPPDILTEIDRYRARIQAQETEVARLQTEKVVDRFSLAEAKYRELLANAWGNKRGHPTTVGLERLERTRLELGIS